MPLPNGDILRGALVRLKPFTADDLPTITTWFADGDFSRHLGSNPVFPRTDWQVVLDEQKNRKPFARDLTFGVRTLANDQLVGVVGLDGISWSHRHSAVSVAIGSLADRGKGYGRAAMELITRYAFHELNLRRLFLTVFSYNTAAIALYESLGWVHEGTQREHLERDGQVYDMLIYGLLRREWEVAQGSVD